MKLKIIFLSVLLFLSGCLGPSPEEIQKLHYGSKPNKIEISKIKSYMEVYLKDPDSAKYKIISKPKKVYIIDEFANVKSAGWAIEIAVNAKNSYGGYTGYKTYYVMIDSSGYVEDIFNILGCSITFKCRRQLRFVDSN